MTEFEDRLRTAPSERFSGAEHQIDLIGAAKALRAEPHLSSQGHRQIALLHHGPVRLILYAFDLGGRLPEHHAPGWTTMHVLRGTITVVSSLQHYTLQAGQVLALDPGVPHSVEAVTESDMLLGVYPSSVLAAEVPGA